MAWTKDQEKAINISDKNVLVSAAAGSGKTAVLTERIVSRIISGKTEADRIVVVTFTKAAAAEMKERIHKELEKALIKDPDNKRIFTQLTLLQDADITTIHSFCQSIIRTHFEEAGIDPDFRVAENGEEKLLEEDVFDEVLEGFYEENSEDFYDFITAFGGKKSDKEIEKTVKSLYYESQNNPWPEDWLDDIQAVSALTGYDELINSPVVKYLVETARRECREYEKSLLKYVDLFTPESGLSPYLENVYAEAGILRKCADAKNCEEMHEAFMGETAIESLSKAGKNADADLKKRFMAFRKKYKEYLKKNDMLFSRIVDKETGVLSELKNTSGFIDVLVRITKAFTRAYDAKKRERNIITFSDMEHLALNILVKREKDKNSLTDAAKDLKDFYDEILVDEYQDSNYVQDEILNAISSGKNRYMVGDVKQSIYGFRNARPEIFIGKYDTFPTEDSGDDQKIILQNNFRSRGTVLEGINAVFKHVMKKEFCGIGYGKDEALVPGLEYPKATPLQKVFEKEAGRINLEYVYTEEDERREGSQLEAELIAMRIRELMASGYMVYDKDEKKYRALHLRDIVILSRTTKNFTETVDVLMNAGVGAHAESKDSYLDTFELRPVISLLNVLDNPLDDIALASVMLSYFGGFTADELARIRVTDSYDLLYNNLLVFADEKNDDEILQEKAGKFLEMINNMRELAHESAVYDTIWHIIYDTGYYRYIATVESPEKRLANIELLLNQAALFAGTSYNGLFQFIRYVKKVKEAKEEAGEVSVLSENEDVVRLMTIHKSKGLEFPVVFIMGMTGGFNLITDKADFVCHDELGIAINDINAKRRTRRKTVFKKAIINRIKRDEISEELRLLYVAMTRAREKLFLVGSGKDESFEKFLKVQPGDDFGINDLYNTHNYIELCLPVALDDLEGAKYFDVNITDSSNINPDSSPEPAKTKNTEEVIKDIKIPLDKPYEFEAETHMRPKVTVTELKNGAYVSDEEKARDYRLEEAAEEINESSAGDKKNEKRKGGTTRGSAYHKLMEFLDHENEDIEGQIRELVDMGLMDEESAGMIKADDIRAFLGSGIGKRAREAYKDDRLKREQEFMIGIPQDNMTDLLLVQGVVDMYIEDEEAIILVDYKTDYVMKSDGEKVLADRYMQQLSYYAKALEQATGKPVKEKIIYSFALGKEIHL